MNKKIVFRTTATAILAALSAVLMMLDFPVAFIMPSFIKMDFSDLPAVFASIMISPTSGVTVSLIKCLVNFPFSKTGGTGELANFILSATFAFVTGIVYKHLKNLKGMILAGISGSFAMACISVPVNYFLTYPAYIRVFHLTEEGIISLYQAIYPRVNSVLSALLIFNVPFNIIKCLINVVLAALIYKSVKPLFKKFV